jgi:RNA polymerase sigma-70 factor (ECF subfamily)
MDQDEAVRLLMAQRNQVLGFLVAILGSRDLAEDIMQDLAVLVMRKHASIPGTDAFPGWIRIAARFEARNRLRRERRGMLDERALDRLEDAWPAEDVGGEDERQAALRTCLGRLGPTARTLVDLRYHEGLDCPSIAGRLGRPINTVYVGLTRLHRALGDCIRQRLARKPA